MKIACWSGPRNLSTAMMYSFFARGDCAVWDEPFYAAYLEHTGLDHPMREETLAAHERDPQAVAARCAGPIPDGKAHFYMKHMAFHMCDGFPIEWADGCTHIHLIRHPARVIASYAAKRENPTLGDIGFAGQLALYEQLGGVIVNTEDIRANPGAKLQALCDAIGLPYTEAMLSWPAGGIPADGAWAPHWYGAIHRSTGFAGPEGPLPELVGPLAELCAQALPAYEALNAHAM